MADSCRDCQALNSIIATWQISFEYIQTSTPTAAQLLSLMCLFDRQGIPESFLHDRYEADPGEADSDDDIHALTSFSLVGISVNGRKFEMHWLVLHRQLGLWQAKYAALMDDSHPVRQHEYWLACR